MRAEVNKQKIEEWHRNKREQFKKQQMEMHKFAQVNKMQTPPQEEAQKSTTPKSQVEEVMIKPLKIIFQNKKRSVHKVENIKSLDRGARKIKGKLSNNSNHVTSPLRANAEQILRADPYIAKLEELKKIQSDNHRLAKMKID